MASPDPPPITIRRGTLLEHREIGAVASDSYFDTALIRFLNPGAAEHYPHYQRGSERRVLRRMLDPRNLTFVAVTDEGTTRSTSTTNSRGIGAKRKTDAKIETPRPIIVGYIQLQRLGDDAGARAQIRSHSRAWRVWLWLLSWLAAAWWAVAGGDKSASASAWSAFAQWGAQERAVYWTPYEARRNRWYVQSCVVRREYQGRGVGKRLIAEVVARAQGEGVVVGLESTPQGERLYRSMGFDLLGRSDYGELVFGEAGGGIMMWSPKGRKDVL